MLRVRCSHTCDKAACIRAGVLMREHTARTGWLRGWLRPPNSVRGSGCAQRTARTGFGYRATRTSAGCSLPTVASHRVLTLCRVLAHIRYAGFNDLRAVCTRTRLYLAPYGRPHAQPPLFGHYIKRMPVVKEVGGPIRAGVTAKIAQRSCATRTSSKDGLTSVRPYINSK